MSSEQAFFLHPGAAQDITDIWEFIADDNPPPLVECERIS